jgi:hypothetical protein
MPATTEFARSNKVSKLVGYLPIEEAVRLWCMTIVALIARVN